MSRETPGSLRDLLWYCSSICEWCERHGGRTRWGTHLASTPSTSRFRFHGSTSKMVMMNNRTLRLVIASDPYVDNDRIYVQLSVPPTKRSETTHFIAPDLLLVISLQDGLHQI